MVKFVLKQKLLKSKRLARLKTVKKSTSSKATVIDDQKVGESMVSHISPIKLLKPFYQGGRIQISNSILFSIYQSKVIYEIDGVQQLIQHNQEDIVNFAVTHRNDYIATFTNNYMIRYCQLSDSAVQFTQKTDPLFAVDMEFSPEDVFLALGGTNCFVRILNVKKNALATDIRVSGSVVKIAWVPIMKKLQLAIATDDRKVSLFDLVANRILCVFVDFRHKITGISFNQHYLITSSNKEIKIWDTSLQKLKETIEVETEIECILAIKNTIIMGTQTGVLYIRNEDKKLIKENQLEGQEIMKIMFSNNQIYITTSELHVYKAHLYDDQLFIDKLMLGFNDEILDCKFIPHNQLILATNSPFMKLVDLNTMEVLAWRAHYSVIMCCQFIDNLIITGSKDNCVIIFKYTGFNVPQQLHKYSGHSDDVVSIDVNRSVIASVSDDKTLKLWSLHDYTSDQSLNTVMAHEKSMNCVKFSPNNKLIATSSQDRTIKIWDDNLMLKMVLKGHKRGVWDVKFSPKEKLIASASGDNTVKIWNLADGSVVKSFQATAPQLKVDWLFKGQELISGDSEGNIKLWNIKKQTCINTISGHEGKIYALDQKQQDGNLLFVTGANDSNLIIWKDDTEQIQQQNQLKQHEIQIKLQSFQDFMNNQLYVDAAFLAYQHNYIKHFIQAMDEIQKIENEEMINSLSKKLIQDDLVKYLTLLNSLNQTKKSCLMAQILFYNSIKQQKITKEMIGEKKAEIKKLIEQFKFTTSKQYDRIENYYRQTFLIQYMIDKNKIVV